VVPTTESTPAKQVQHGDADEDIRPKIYWHIGVLGFDKVMIHAFHPHQNLLFGKPPPIESLYPAGKSCVLNWHALGYVDWQEYVVTQPLGYGASSDHWFRKSFLEGYSSLKAAGFDWVLVNDVDEFLVPAAASMPSLKNSSKIAQLFGPDRPTLIRAAVTDMLAAIATPTLCPNNSWSVWEVSHGYKGCRDVGYICFPGRITLTAPNTHNTHNKHNTQEPSLGEVATAHSSRAYNVYLPIITPPGRTQQPFMTNLSDALVTLRSPHSKPGQHMCWKSLYNTATPNSFVGNVLHIGSGFSAGAPQGEGSGFTGLTLEIAHMILPSRHNVFLNYSAILMEQFYSALAPDNRFSTLIGLFDQAYLPANPANVTAVS
jgi:hypothetical protein